MARVKPKQKDPRYPNRPFRRTAVPQSRTFRTNQSFTRFTVVWTDRNGVPFNTGGFFLRVFRGGTLVGTAFFDNYGVAITNLSTPTRTALTIRAYNSNGVLFRTRNVPAGVAFFAIIG